MDWKDELIARILEGECSHTLELPTKIRQKYQAYNGGQFHPLIVLYLEKLEDRVKALEDKEGGNDET